MTATITILAEKGSPLSHTEMDNNFRALRALVDVAADVKWFGATGDGVTDDAAAITSALSGSEAIRFSPGDYFIDSNLTISKPVVFDKGAVLLPGSGVTVTFARGSTDSVHAEWFGSDGAAIQHAVNGAARYVKHVFVGPGIWTVTTPIEMPETQVSGTNLEFYGVCIEGAAPAYQYGSSTGGLEGTGNIRCVGTVLKASGAIDYIIGGRPGYSPPQVAPSTHTVYYTTLKNLTFDGAATTQCGYVAGYFDRILDCHFAFFAGPALAFPANSINALVERCSLTYSAYGAAMTGNTTTITFRDVNIRENTSGGVLIVSGTHITMTDCIFESNAGYALEIATGKSGDFSYPTPGADNIVCRQCYFEANNGIVTAIGIASAIVYGLNFTHCRLQNNKPANPLAAAVQVNADYTRQLYFDNCEFINVGFTVTTTVLGCIITGLRRVIANASSIPSINGTGAANVCRLGYEDDGNLQLVDYHYLSGGSVRPILFLTATATLTKKDVARGTIRVGGSADITLTLPDIDNDSVETFIVCSADNAGITLTIAAPSGGKIRLSSTDYVSIQSQQLYQNTVRLTAYVLGGVQYYRAETIQGTWTGTP